MPRRFLLTRFQTIILLIVLTLGMACSDSETTSTPSEDIPSSDVSVTDVPPASDAAAGDIEPETSTSDAVTDTGAGPGPKTCATEVILEEAELELVNGETSDFTFYVPEDAVSVGMTVSGIEGVTYSLARWEGPSTTLVQDGWMNMPDNQGGLCFTCPIRIAPSQGAVASMTPNNPNGIVESGDHSARVMAFTLEGGFGGFGGTPTPASGIVSVRVHAKLKESLPDTGTLNLNLHFTGSKGWTAATAPTNDEFQAILKTMGEAYAEVGISLGRIEYFDVDPVYKVIESIDGEDSDLSEMFRLSSQGPIDAVNVFFVEELIGPFGAGFGVLLGISGGIPGPILSPGTARSGVAIATKEQDQLPVSLETTVAHEVGHYLGLFHILEDNFGGLFPTIYDPLPDTPEANDTEWLMHFNGTGLKLSPWQGIVMRSNPVICH